MQLKGISFVAFPGRPDVHGIRRPGDDQVSGRKRKNPRLFAITDCGDPTPIVGIQHQLWGSNVELWAETELGDWEAGLIRHHHGGKIESFGSGRATRHTTPS